MKSLLATALVLGLFFLWWTAPQPPDPELPGVVMGSGVVTDETPRVKITDGSSSFSVQGGGSGTLRTATASDYCVMAVPTVSTTTVSSSTTGTWSTTVAVPCR